VQERVLRWPADPGQRGPGADRADGAAGRI